MGWWRAGQLGSGVWGPRDRGAAGRGGRLHRSTGASTAVGRRRVGAAGPLARGGPRLRRGGGAESPQRGGALGAGAATGPARRDRHGTTGASGGEAPVARLHPEDATEQDGRSRSPRSLGRCSTTPKCAVHAAAERVGGSGPAQPAATRRGRAGLRARAGTAGAEADPPPARRARARGTFAARGLASSTSCEHHRLPPAVTNVDVLGHEVDVLWPAARLIVELDSWEHHSHRAAFERDRARTRPSCSPATAPSASPTAASTAKPTGRNGVPGLLGLGEKDRDGD